MAVSLAAAFAQDIPRPAPEFTIHLSDGSQVLTSQYSGKVVLLAFMATT
jgi:peroxiredoxin